MTVLVVAQAVPEPGETVGHAASGLAGEAVWSCLFGPAREHRLEAFLFSTGVVALAEVGDKTQLLALMLAAKFRKPLPIVLGILVATVANHAVAGALGTWITALVGHRTLRWALGVSFIAMAAWMLMPDRLEAREVRLAHLGVFGATALAFFLVEMGDKTQVATVALAAQYRTFLPVVAGTTLGMLVTNVPAVFLGERIAHRLPVRLIHGIAALIFTVLGVATLLGAGAPLGL